MLQNPAIMALKFVFIDLIGDIIYFPVWWYSKGAKKSSIFFWQRFKAVSGRFGVDIWVKNLFTPMYGQTDWQSKLISFFMRLVQIIFRSIGLLIWAIVLTAVFIFWLILPILIIYQIIITLFF